MFRSRVLSRVHRFLRSGRTAGWLLALLGVWMGLATAVPQGTLTEPEVAIWRGTYPALASLTSFLGLHRAFVAPVFVALVGVLTVSTALCSWSRTRTAIRGWRSVGVVDPARLGRLERSPGCVFEVPGASPEMLLQRTEAVLRGLGLRVRSGPRLAEGVSGVWARFASPLFHWSLVGLFVAIPLGQLTSASGLMGVPVGGSVLDEPEAYGLLNRGPWHRSLSGLFVGVEEMPLAFVAGGVDRGAAPLVTLSRPDGTEVARGHVYPNHALRHGSLVVHMSDYGLVAGFSLTEEGGQAVRTEQLLDFDEAASDGTTVTSFGMFDESDIELAVVEVTIPLDRADDGSLYYELPRPPVARVEIANLQTGETSSAMLAPGEGTETPAGRLVLDRLGYYARLSLVDDWSIPFVYAFLTIASLTVAVSLLVPYRVVWVLRMGEPGAERLHVAVRAGRGDSGFRERVADALAEEFGAGENRTDNEGERR